MPPIELPVRETADMQPQKDRGSLAVPHGTADLPGHAGIPPAFLQEGEPPPPPPDDPHWQEWPHEGRQEPIPRLVLIGLPIAVGALGILHILVILVVLMVSSAN